MLIRCGSRVLAVGLDWLMPESDKEMKAAKKARRSSYYASANIGRQYWVGFHDPVKDEAYAGALLVAMVKPNAIVFHPIDDGHAWVCAITDGMPLVGHDRVWPIEEGRDKAIEWSSLFVKADMVGEMSGAQTTLDDVLATIDEGIASKVIRKKQIAIALLNKNGLSLMHLGRKAAMLAALLAVGGGGAALWQWQQTQTAEQMSLAEAGRRAMLELQSKEQQEAARTAAVTEFHRQVETMRTTYSERASPVQWLATLTMLEGRLPLSQLGYKPTTYECGAEQCRVTWQGQGRFVQPADKASLPNVEPNAAADLTATSVFGHRIPREPLPAVNAANIEDYRFRLQSGLTVRVPGFQMEPATPMTVNPPNGVTQAAVVVARVGKWHARFPGSTSLIQGRDFVAQIRQLPMRVTAIRYQVGISLDIDGEYIFLMDAKR